MILKDSENDGEREKPRKKEGWLELTLTVIVALAALGTAWAGFQSAKWSGVQANAYAKASAVRTESTRQSTRSGQLMTIDVTTFVAWLNALDRERPTGKKTGAYDPDPLTLSGVLFNRLRPEFKPAVQAWLATKPLLNPKAPPTPFVMPEYERAAGVRAEALLKQADELSATARAANQRSDNYVLTAVLLAMVLFFAALAGRAGSRTKYPLFTVASIALIVAVVLLAVYPIEV